MERAKVINALRSRAETIRSFGATGLYLFGSTARDQAGTASDVDLFVDYDDEKFSFVELIRLGDYLSELLAARADLTTREGLHPMIRDEIERTAVRIF
jgi:predicted nucleotidyltransferase